MFSAVTDGNRHPGATAPTTPPPSARGGGGGGNWINGFSDYGVFGLLHFKIIGQFFGLLSHWTNGFSDYCAFGSMTRRDNGPFFFSIGLSDQWTFGLLGFRTSDAPE